MVDGEYAILEHVKNKKLFWTTNIDQDVIKKIKNFKIIFTTDDKKRAIEISNGRFIEISNI